MEGSLTRPAEESDQAALAKRPRARTQAELQAEHAQLTADVEILERELHERELLLAAIAAVKEAIVITDPSLPENPIIWANHRFFELTGFTQEETLGRNGLFLHGDETCKEDLTKLRDSISRREPATVTIRSYRRDGTSFWNELMATPFMFGEKNHYVILQADVTAHHERLTQHMLRDKALNVCNESVVIVDMLQPDQPIIYCNNGFLRMTGYRRDEVIGKNCRFLQGQDTDKSAVSRVRNGISMRATLAVELLNYRKDGRTFWNQFSLTPVFAPGGKQCTHYIAVQYEHPMVVNGRNQGVEFVAPL